MTAFPTGGYIARDGRRLAPDDGCSRVRLCGAALGGLRCGLLRGHDGDHEDTVPHLFEVPT